MPIAGTDDDGKRDRVQPSCFFFYFVLFISFFPIQNNATTSASVPHCGPRRRSAAIRPRSVGREAITTAGQCDRPVNNSPPGEITKPVRDTGETCWARPRAPTSRRPTAAPILDSGYHSEYLNYPSYHSCNSTEYYDINNTTLRYYGLLRPTTYVISARVFRVLIDWIPCRYPYYYLTVLERSTDRVPAERLSRRKPTTDDRRVGLDPSFRTAEAIESRTRARDQYSHVAHYEVRYWEPGKTGL